MPIQINFFGEENPAYGEVFANFTARFQSLVFRMKGQRSTPLLAYGQIESGGEDGQEIGRVLIPKRHFQIAVFGLRENQRRPIITLGILDILTPDVRNMLFTSEIVYASPHEKLEGLFTACT